MADKIVNLPSKYPILHLERMFLISQGIPSPSGGEMPTPMAPVRYQRKRCVATVAQ